MTQKTLTGILLLTLILFSQAPCFAGYPSDTSHPEPPKDRRPRNTAIMSAVVPGLGQVYNRKYWKVPIIYGGAAALYMWGRHSNIHYACFRSAHASWPAVEPCEAVPNIGIYDQRMLRIRRDEYRRDLEMSIILGTVLYALNILDAYVDAHLRRFDISEDLALSMRPFFYQDISSQIVSGLTLNFSLKK